jgi:UDP-N-acetylmuramyl pentapeptide phosphotransferase/UDP-N-acetylglucosamine-1-phosphate transferase
LTSALLLCFSPLLYSLNLYAPLSYLFFLVVFVLLLITSTAAINFTNFMDGLDGLVAGCMIIVISSIAFVLSSSWSLWSLVGALLGFLIWNWSPAKVFMGDVGSTFLGAVFVGLVFQATSWLQALSMLLVATPLLSDAFCCVLRRFFAGQRIFEAHRLHLFQRLYQAGWPHARVSLTYVGATAILAIALIVGDWPFVTGLAGLELLIGLWLDQRVAVPFDFASAQ